VALWSKNRMPNLGPMPIAWAKKINHSPILSLLKGSGARMS
jgi:hypothetical protein